MTIKKDIKIEIINKEIRKIETGSNPPLNTEVNPNPIETDPTLASAEAPTTTESNDDPTEVLEIGNTYKVSSVEVHKQHTKLTIEGYSGRFNSVCFSKEYAE